MKATCDSDRHSAAPTRQLGECRWDFGFFINGTGRGGGARVGSRQRADGRAGWKRGKNSGVRSESREREQRGEETNGRGERESN
jgi:hypothetical protein